MKACGLSLWQIVAPIVLWSIILSSLCIYNGSVIAPNSRYAQRQVLVNLGMEEPVNLLEEGRFVRDFPGMMIYVGKRDRQQVTDVVVYELGEGGIKKNVRAKSGTMKPDMKNNRILIDLYDVRIDEIEISRDGVPHSRYISAQHYPVKLDFSHLVKKTGGQKKKSDMTYIELIRAIRDVRGAYPDLNDDDLLRQRMALVVESNKRLALSLSCFAFTLLGIPLGIKSHRKESSIGVGISLLLVFFFYFFIVLADSLVGHPEFRPDLILWIPVVGAELFGFYLLYRAR
jgi:lipopolysaccharide export system permease protein